MMSRPVFVPSGKRRTKQQQQRHQQRFHGAFTGGFSAGYFNTVDTKEGWAPKQNEDDEEEPDSLSKQRKPQKMEDFMDEQDFNEWGGPTSVKRAFSEVRVRKPAAATALLFSVEPPPNVGRRLLRILGWRDGGTAYVEDAIPTTTARAPPSSDNDCIAAHLSERKLRRIRLQQTLGKLPSPKLDTCGLGYDAFRVAPEFQKHREHLRRTAQARIQAVTNKTGSNVYRLSDLTSAHPDEDELDDDDHDVAHDTMKDFVGAKSVGGFALREDDDDVYDAAPLAKDASTVKIDKEKYDMELYDHTTSDEDASEPNTNSNVGGIFLSWAADSAGEGIARGVTFNGRQPLLGFVLGGASSTTIQKRYPGPDLPPNFELKRHVFADDVCRQTFQSESVVERIISAVQQASSVQREERPQGAMAGATFVGLAAAMKSRFSAPTSAEEKAVHPAGLHVPSFRSATVADEPPQITEAPKIEKKEIKLTRRTTLFVPDPLLCKRFHVKPPSHAKSSTLERSQGAEASFFEKDVLMQAVGAKPSIKPLDHGANDVIDEAPESRPDMKVYQSIFQPESESSDSDLDEPKELTDDSGKLTNTRPPGADFSLPPKPTGVPRPSETMHSDPFLPTTAIVPANTGHVESILSDRDSRKKRRKTDDGKHSRRSLEDGSSTDQDDSDSDGYRRKRRKEKKHRKKEKRKKLSSRRHHDD
jgi:G patch domain-containing protein 1